MQIRKCGMEDLEPVTALYDKATLYLAAHVNYPRWTPGVYPGRESVRQAIGQGVQYLAADEDGCVRGVFILNEDPQGDYSAGEWTQELARGEYLVIHTLAADPEYYGHGVGKEMVRWCLELAESRGYPAVRLDVVPENFPARRLYEKMGFRFAGEKDLKRDIAEIPVFALYEKAVKCVTKEGGTKEA